MGKKVCQITFENVGRSSHTAGYYGQKKWIKLRTEVNKLYFGGGFSKNAIAAAKGVSKRFVIRWTESPEQDFSIDNRDWPMGKRRKWTPQTEQRISQVYAERKAKKSTGHL